MSTIVLQGITWGHSRGYTPLIAFSQRFSELHPEVEIVWTKRSLQEFADFPLEKLTRHYDLLIIDHPWVGTAAAKDCVLPLDKHLPGEYLDNQLQNSVGASHLSYAYENHQWALAIDASAPAASFRNDLFEYNNATLPQDWNALLELARKGKIAAPAIPIDLLMNFYTFCIANGTEPFANEEEVIDQETGLIALATMRQFYSLLDERMFLCNPIAVAEMMSTSDEFWYCPFAYAYSNYSRIGYARKLLQYTQLVKFNGVKLRSTIGGTGLAVSTHSANKQWALKFTEAIVSEECQRTFYMEHGGQPGHRAAWTDDQANILCNQFFKNLLPVMENGYVRPRYHGYLQFQDLAGDPLHHFLQHGGNEKNVLDKINHIYRQSIQHALV